jgi:hypothetical protein
MKIINKMLTTNEIGELTRALELCSQKNKEVEAMKNPSLFRVLVQREFSKDIMRRAYEYNASLTVQPGPDEQLFLEDDMKSDFKNQIIPSVEMTFDFGYHIVKPMDEIPVYLESETTSYDVQSDFNIWSTVSNLFTNEKVDSDVESDDFSNVFHSPFQNIWNTDPFYNSLSEMCIQQNIWQTDSLLLRTYPSQNIW